LPIDNSGPPSRENANASALSRLSGPPSNGDASILSIASAAASSLLSTNAVPIGHSVCRLFKIPVNDAKSALKRFPPPKMEINANTVRETS
jgi:hypothetical protein